MKGDINWKARDMGFTQLCCNLTVALDNFLPRPEPPHLDVEELVAVDHSCPAAEFGASEKVLMLEPVSQWPAQMF